MRIDHVAALAAALSASDAALRGTEQMHATALQDVHDKNARLSLENDKCRFDLSEARDRGDADLADERRWGAEQLLTQAGQHAIELKEAHEELAQLRLAIGWMDIDATEAKLIGLNDQQAHDKDDAILKRTQNQGALDLKRTIKENTDLRNELAQAREWLSGSYSSCQGSIM